MSARRNTAGKVKLLIPALSLWFILAGALPARAHCDGTDGPVVNAARKALETGDANHVLVWVQPGDESEIRRAFARTLALRKLNPEARELADTYFYETIVRLHRAGEGEPYTGLKPAGRDLGPAIPAADKAIQIGSDESLVKMLTEVAAQGIRDRYRKVAAARDFPTNDVSAGREYVKAYVDFLHFVEGLHAAAHRGSHGASHEQVGAGNHDEH